VTAVGAEVTQPLTPANVVRCYLYSMACSNL